MMPLRWQEIVSTKEAFVDWVGREEEFEEVKPK